jgi:diacylglycerol kinase family enzyme
MVAKFIVKEAPLVINAKNLASVIRKGDLVLSAGGDGTAAVVANAVLLSGKNATMAVMPFGNFNDFAETLGKMDFERIIKKFEEGRFDLYYPMEVMVDGRHYVYSSVYFTVGMLAEAAGIMKRTKVRKKLKKARNRLWFTARKTFKWYVKNKRRNDFLPIDARLNKRKFKKGTTDYVAMNGKSMAGLVPGGTWYELEDQFWSGAMRNRSFWRLLDKFAKSLEGKLPGGLAKMDVLSFPEKSDVFVHTEGEGECLKEVKEIKILKSGRCLRVIKA